MRHGDSASRKYFLVSGTGLRLAAVWVLGLFLMSCAGNLVDVNVTIVDQKTALENQILGSYEELGKDMMLLASVRSVDESGRLKSAATVPPGKMQAIRAMQRQEFNRDDILMLKQTGCAAEGNDGLLVFFETEKTGNDPHFKEFAQALIGEENEDRLAILSRIVATNENFSEQDLAKARKIYASLNRDSARPNDKIQLEDGSWVIKK